MAQENLSSPTTFKPELELVGGHVRQKDEVQFLRGERIRTHLPVTKFLIKAVVTSISFRSYCQKQPLHESVILFSATSFPH